MSRSLGLAIAIMASTACGASRFSATKEASQAERQISGCYAIHYRALNQMARWQREMDGAVDTLLLTQDLVMPRGPFTDGAPAGRLLLRSFDDTTYIARGEFYSYWRLDGGVLTLGWSAMLGGAVAHLHPSAAGYVGVDSVSTDVYVPNEPQPVFDVTARRVTCPTRLAPAT